VLAWLGASYVPFTIGVPVPLNSHSLDRIPWMPSPPLVPDECLIDTAHLARMTMGDASLQHEVLTLFIAQSASLIDRLALLPADAAALAHTLKGSARGIGAFAVAASAERLERALSDRKAEGSALADLQQAINGTVREIEQFLGLAGPSKN
jgi:HPt (histidine-containing phosphotransfer) domain-containing protein